jgi:hypothetical protein
VARDHGRPQASPEPKAERRLLALLGSKAAFVVMCYVLVVVAAALLAVLAAKL